MDLNSKYSASELLTQLLDGELDSNTEQLLYDNLAQNPELQSEMKDMLSIRESIRKDTEAFTPPAELSKQVFSNLGFVQPVPQSPYRPLFKYSVLALLLISFTTFVAFQSDMIFGNSSIESQAKNSLENNEISNSLAKTSSQTTDNHSIVSNNIPVVSSIETSTGKNLSNKTALRRNSIIRANTLSDNNLDANGIFVTNEFSDDFVPNSNIIAQNSGTTNRVEILSHNTNSKLVEFPASNQYAAFNNSFIFARSISAFDIGSDRSNSKRSKTINLRGIYAVSQDENKLQTNVLNSFSASAFIQTGFAENLSLGVEFGREPYSQIFLNSNAIDYNQQPTVMWLGVGARYDFNEINLFGTTPFSQIIAGGSELGPIGRVLIGTSKYLSNNIGFNIGIESSLMLYKNQNKYYTSDKIGITGGILYKF